MLQRPTWKAGKPIGYDGIFEPILTLEVGGASGLAVRFL